MHMCVYVCFVIAVARPPCMADCRSVAKGFATSSSRISYVVVVVFASRFRGVIVASQSSCVLILCFFSDRLRPVWLSFNWCVVFCFCCCRFCCCSHKRAAAANSVWLLCHFVLVIRWGLKRNISAVKNYRNYGVMSAAQWDRCWGLLYKIKLL